MSIRATLLLLTLAPAISRAEPTDDGYCDYVEGAAAANAAPLLAPQAFGQFGYIEQPAFAVTPSTDTSNLRAIGGVRYSLSNIYAGYATKSRASADCRRHQAIVQLRGATEVRALAARAAVYDEAQGEASQILNEVEAGLESHRTTAPEATAMRLRVEELRTLAATTHRQLAALPPPDQRPLRNLLSTYQDADRDVEKSEAKLRSVRAYDLSVRVGADRFLQGASTSTQYFAVLELGINIGALWLGNGNARAAAGRSRYARSGRDPLGSDATVEQVRAAIDLDTQRAKETTALVADLERQMQALAALNGDDSKRFRQTLWFDWIKAKAELAAVQAELAAMHEVLGS